MKESQIAVMEEFVDNVKILISALGYKVLEPLNKPIVISSECGEKVEFEDLSLHLERTIKGVGKVEADGVRTSEGFVVLQGSCIAVEDDDTIPAVLKEQRRKVSVVDGVLQEDVLFSSPSYAAMFVIGKSANGLPMMDGIKDATATKITLQFTKQNKSSDAADNINGSKKKHIIRDLGLNLEAIENRKVLAIFKKMQAGKLDQAEAFAQIKAEFKDSDDYNDAEVNLRVGSRNRKVQWNEFESIMGSHDISYALHEACKVSHDFVGELTKLADKYYKDIIESEEV